MTSRILVIATTMPDGVLDPLRAHAEVVRWAGGGLPTSHQLVDEIAGFDGLLCDNRVELTRAVFDRASQLRFVSLVGAGVSSTDLRAAAESGVVVMNTPGVMATSVAELTIGLLICLARDVVAQAETVRSRSWSTVEATQLGRGLEGMRLGLVGFGACGRAVAERASAFGMEIAYCDPHVPDGPMQLDLDGLLRWSDAVSLHADLNPTTQGLIAGRELGLMRSGGYLLNMARGGLVDQTAVAEAIRSGHLAGAAFDVLEVEPPPPDDPLLDLPGVVIVPHIGAATTTARGRMFTLAANNVVAALAGRPANVVN